MTMTVCGFDNEESFLSYTKREAQDGNSNLSSGEVVVLLEIIERLRQLPIDETLGADD